MSASANLPNGALFPLYEGELITTGLTKREYFAAICLQGLLISQGTKAKPEHAVDYADALIDALNRAK